MDKDELKFLYHVRRIILSALALIDLRIEALKARPADHADSTETIAGVKAYN